MSEPGNSDQPPRPQILGHRANSHRIIEYYKNAEVDGVEVDVIVNHSNRLRVEHVLEENEYLDLLYSAEKGVLPSLKILTYRMRRLFGLRSRVKPPLDDYLTYLSRTWPQAKLMIDVKTPRGPELLDEVIGRFSKSFKEVLVTSKYHTLIAELKVPKGVKRLATLVSRPLHIIEYLDSLGADGISIEYPYVDRDLVQELHRKGYLIAAWTVNDTLVAKHLAKMGVDIIITDTPRKIIKALTPRKSRFPRPQAPGLLRGEDWESPGGFMPFLVGTT